METFKLYCAQPQCPTNIVVPVMSVEDTSALLELNGWWPGFGVNKWVCSDHFRQEPK